MYSRDGGYVASAGMSGDWHKDSVYLSTTLVPVLSLHSPRTQAPDIPAEATYPPSRLYASQRCPDCIMSDFNADPMMQYCSVRKVGLGPYRTQVL